MTKEEAEYIVTKCHCRCDGSGIVLGPKGIAIPCPHCDGVFVSNEQLQEALEYLLMEKSESLSE